MLDLIRRAKPAQHLDANRKRGKAPLEGFEVLQDQNSSWRENCHLLSITQCLERRAHRYFGLAETYIATQEPIHRLSVFHVLLNLTNGGYLIFGRLILERVFEFALPVAVRGKRETLAHLPLR